MSPILQSSLPPQLWAQGTQSKLPGIQPMAIDDWIWRDDAYGAQMALRDQLIKDRRQDVVALHRDGAAAAVEVLQYLLAALATKSGYRVARDWVTRPDGVDVALDMNDPLATAGRLVQEDLCLVQKVADGHVLTGAVLCFPAGWTLAEKMMRPLAAIHAPVPAYGDELDRRVNRLFDAIRVDRPLWRRNGFFYEDPALFAPFSEAMPRPPVSANAKFFRVERQCLLRLPNTNAVVFSIHTFMVDRQNPTPAQKQTIGNQIG